MSPFDLPAVNEAAIRAAMAGHPAWMVADCIAWTRSEEAQGSTFTSGSAAARHWLDMQHAGGVR